MKPLDIPMDIHAEAQTLGSLMLDPDMMPDVRRIVTPEDFFRESHQRIFATMQRLYDSSLPIDFTLLQSELTDIAPSEFTALIDHTPTALYAEHYAALVKKQARLRSQIRTLEQAAGIIDDTGDPDEVESFLRDSLGAAAVPSNALLTWDDSFALRAELRRQYQTKEHKQQLERWSYPWPSWNQRIDPAEPGILMTVIAADGVGKTIVGECLAEHWARKGNITLYCHFELSRKIMMERSMARNASIPRHAIITDDLSPIQRKMLEDVDHYMQRWPGQVEYLKVADKTMEYVVAEAAARTKHWRNLGFEVAVVVDYLEKAEASQRQLKLFGSNITSREANDVNQLKNFSECEGVRMVMLSQFNKEGKQLPFEKLTRSQVRGAGQKTEFSNIVMLLHKEILEHGMAAPGGHGYIIEPGEYARELNIIIDKNTLGKTGRWKALQQTNACFNLEDIAA